MSRTMIFTGVSKTTYDFTAYSVVEPWPNSLSGVYAFVTTTDCPLHTDPAVPVCIGTTDELERRRGGYAVGGEIMAYHPTHFCLLAVADETRRREIENDLVERYRLTSN